MTGIKLLALLSAMGASVAQMDPIATGSKLGSLGASAILGVVCICCVWALVKLYRDKEKDVIESRKAHEEHTERLYKMIEENTKANQKYASNAEGMTDVLLEVKEAVITCRLSGGKRC